MALLLCGVLRRPLIDGRERDYLPMLPVTYRMLICKSLQTRFEECDRREDISCPEGPYPGTKRGFLSGGGH